MSLLNPWQVHMIRRAQPQMEMRQGLCSKATVWGKNGRGCGGLLAETRASWDGWAEFVSMHSSFALFVSEV